MENEQIFKIKKCPFCGEAVDRIWFSAFMTEEWSWNGSNWECSSRHSLVTDPEQNVLCPDCKNIIGTGLDFGFGKGYK